MFLSVYHRSGLNNLFLSETLISVKISLLALDEIKSRGAGIGRQARLRTVWFIP